MNSKILLTMFVTLMAITVTASAQSANQDGITYTSNTKTACFGSSCGTTYYTHAIAFYENDIWNPIDTTIQQLEQEVFGETYYFYSENLFDAYFKQVSGSTAPNTRPVRIVKDDYSITLAPQSLKFEGQTNKHLQQSIGINHKETVIYPWQFGTGIDLHYVYTHDTLKEELVIDTRQDILDNIKSNPDAGSNLTLKFKIRAYRLSNDQDMDLKIGGQKINFDDEYISTEKNVINFLDNNGETIYSIPTPIAVDSKGETIDLYYAIDVNQFGNLVLEIKTPWDWLDTANYPVIIDPSVILKTPDTEVLDDCFTVQPGGASDDRNTGASSQAQIGQTDPADRTEWGWYKFNNTLPDGVTVTNATFYFRVNFDQGYGAATISGYEVNNQTWQEGNFSGAQCLDNKDCEKGLTGLIQPTMVGSGAAYGSTTSKAAGNFIALPSTNLVTAQQALGNFSFMVNGSDEGADTFIQIDTKESGTATSRPYMTINYSVPSNGINITVFSAVDNSTSTPFNVTLTNGTDTVTILNNVNPALLTISSNSLPVGNVEVTIWRDNYINATYDTIINDTHLENLTSKVFTVARGLIDITSPPNGGSTDGTNLTVNITTPDFINGILTNITYRLNNSGSFISLCEDCNNFTGVIEIGGLGSQLLEVRGNSSIYNEQFENSTFSNTFTIYDLLIMDELRNETININLTDSTELVAFCPQNELSFIITNNFTSSLDITCIFEYLELRMKLTNQTSTHSRTLIPDINAQQITFYMFDNQTRNPDTNFVDFELFLDDLTGEFPEGSIVHIKKALNGSIVDIIDQITIADASVGLYLAINERYYLSIESPDGKFTQDLGDLKIRSLTDTEKTITISDIPLFPDLNDFISWNFAANVSELFINFTYNDTQNLTDSVTFRIFNASNPGQMDLVYTSSQNTSDVSFTFTAIANNTYIAQFEADHSELGILTQDVVFIFSSRLFPVGILELNPIWYQIISVIVIMMTALLFGARAGQFGVVVTVIVAGFFMIIGWIPLTIQMGSILILIAVLSWLGLRRREQ